jgi:hypothetical protein
MFTRLQRWSVAALLRTEGATLGLDEHELALQGGVALGVGCGIQSLQ